MKNLLENVQIIIFLIFLAGSGLFVALRSDEPAGVNNFEECVAVTGTVLESFPRQCIHDDQTFVEDIS